MVQPHWKTGSFLIKLNMQLTHNQHRTLEYLYQTNENFRLQKKKNPLYMNIHSSLTPNSQKLGGGKKDKIFFNG